VKLFDWMRGARHAPAAAPAPHPAVAAAQAIVEAGEAQRAMDLHRKLVAAGLSARATREAVDACKVFDCRVIVVPPGVDVTFKPAGKR
jgi:hypothetical protein